MSIRPGQTFGQYEIIEPIGKGGMATVYRATQASIGREVALKVLPREFIHDDTFLGRFTREVQVIASLQHLHILPVYDFGQQDDIPYIAMAYLPGGTLSGLIRQGPMELPDVTRLVGQMADALDYAHEKGIIHRDFKPSNVLLDDRGNAFLADFGIARVAESTVQLTGTGALVGTPAYMAPKMYSKGELTPAVDIYALGITLYQMLTGRLPFDADTPVQFMMSHVNDPVPDVRILRSDLPDDTQAVIETALAKAPEARYQSAVALSDALASAARGESQPLVPPMQAEPKATFSTEAIMPPPTPRATKRNLTLMSVGGALLALICVGVSIAVLLVTGAFGGGTGDELATEKAEAAADTLTDTLDPTPISGASGLISFHSNRDGSLDFDVDIYVMDADGSNVVQLTDNGFRDVGPSWAPDGRRIAFTSNLDLNTDIYLMDADGSNLLQLTDDPAGDHSPDWSPDGSRIVFLSSFNVMVMDADGSNVVQLADDPALEFKANPAWSPDGARIAFYALRDGNWDIYVVDAVGSNVVQLTDDPNFDGSPAWSPDGRRIAFYSGRDGDFDIYVMDADGSNVVQLTDDPDC